MPSTNLKKHQYIIFILSFTVYASGLIFLILGLWFRKKSDSKFIYPEENTDWFINKPIDFVYWVFIYTINTFIGGINMCHFLMNWLDFSSILFMFFSNIATCSFLMGLYSVFLTWPVIVFFSILYTINWTTMYKILIILHKQNYTNTQTNNTRQSTRENSINIRNLPSLVFELRENIGFRNIITATPIPDSAHDTSHDTSHESEC